MQFINLLELSDPKCWDEVSLYLFKKWIKGNNLTYSKLKKYKIYFSKDFERKIESDVIKREFA